MTAPVTYSLIWQDCLTFCRNWIVNLYRFTGTPNIALLQLRLEEIVVSEGTNIASAIAGQQIFRLQRSLNASAIIAFGFQGCTLATLGWLIWQQSRISKALTRLSSKHLTKSGYVLRLL
jgi:hypothetical protein